VLRPLPAVRLLTTHMSSFIIPRMVKLNLYVTEQQKATLDKLSEKTGVPTSEFIRRAIDAALKKAK
jgi:hypothetical protein